MATLQIGACAGGECARWQKGMVIDYENIYERKIRAAIDAGSGIK